MEQATRICKVCGKEYPYCRSEAAGSENRWQDVGCCIEHAIQYFKEIAISRGELPEEEEKKEDEKPIKADEKKEDKRDLKGDKNTEDKVKK